jgi:hypothetical protein
MATSNIDTKFGTTYDGAEFVITVNGSPLNLVGASAVMQIRFSFDTAVIKEYALGSGLTLTDPANGKFTFDNQIIDLPPSDKYKYDILITLANGTKKIYPSGNFYVRPVITHG